MIHPTEQDGEWVYDALAGLMPDQLSEEWVDLGVHEDPNTGAVVSRFRLRGQPLTVYVAINPVMLKGADAKKVSYHVTIFRDSEGKIQAPREQDINRAASAFILRNIRPGEQVHNGCVGESKAHHIMLVVDHSPIILTGV